MATRTGKTRQNEQMGFVDAALADCGGPARNPLPDAVHIRCEPLQP